MFVLLAKNMENSVDGQPQGSSFQGQAAFLVHHALSPSSIDLESTLHLSHFYSLTGWWTARVDAVYFLLLLIWDWPCSLL